MEIVLEVRVPGRKTAVKARLYKVRDDYFCKSLDDRYQVVGTTMGSALDMFVDRLQGSQYLASQSVLV